MYQEIKKHILEGKLKLAFEEIAALNLSRDQRDELLKVEARYNRLQREGGQMTAEMRGIESERLNDRVLKLINWVSDDKRAPSAAPGIGDVLSRPTQKGSTTKLPYFILAGILLLAIGSWAVGVFESTPAKQMGKGIIEKQEPTDTPGSVGEKEPTVDPGFKASESDESQVLKPIPATTLPNTTIPREAIVKENTRPASTAIRDLAINKKPVIRLYYSRKKALINLDEQNAIAFGRRLQSALSGYTVITKSPSGVETLTENSVVKLLNNGASNQGSALQKHGVSYIMIVQETPVGNPPYRKIEAKFAAFRCSDGEMILSKQSRTMDISDRETGPKHVADRFTYWVARK